jgi:hypothetical protein
MTASPALPPADPAAPWRPAPGPLDHPTLEALAAAYAQAVDARRDRQAALRARLLAASLDLVPALRAASAAERDAHDALLAAVTATPDLFRRPRTRTVHGVKYGWQAGKASIAIPDEAKTLALIKQKLPPEQQVLLIRVKESVERRAVLDLTAQDLRRLAITQVPGQDAPLVSLPKDDIDKLVDTLLAASAGEDA